MRLTDQTIIEKKVSELLKTKTKTILNKTEEKRFKI